MEKPREAVERVPDGSDSGRLDRVTGAMSSADDQLSAEERFQREARAFFRTLNAQQRRLYGALEANRLGTDGKSEVRRKLGIAFGTIARGRAELALLLQGQSPPARLGKNPGRRPLHLIYPNLLEDLEELLLDETAGSPVDQQKWIRSSVRSLAARLGAKGYTISYRTVAKLLKRLGYSQRTAVRVRRGGCKVRESRDRQFIYIASQRRSFLEKGLPVVSVDGKKKELIGNFRRPGKTWSKEPVEVNEYTFASLASGVAAPYGIYDLKRNTGFVVVSLSHETAEFAVASIARWWTDEGQTNYPEAQELLILADSGGSNGVVLRAWKFYLQEKLCNPFALSVTVCHYPPGCSKWNPIERMLFAQISRNWAGKALQTVDIMMGYIRGTTTAKGLVVSATVDETVYPKRRKFSRKEVESLNIVHPDVCAGWNYTIRPVEHSRRAEINWLIRDPATYVP
jgi:hypothetical protein